MMRETIGRSRTGPFHPLTTGTASPPTCTRSLDRLRPERNRQFRPRARRKPGFGCVRLRRGCHMARRYSDATWQHVFIAVGSSFQTAAVSRSLKVFQPSGPCLAENAAPSISTRIFLTQFLSDDGTRAATSMQRSRRLGFSDSGQIVIGNTMKNSTCVPPSTPRD